MTKEIKKEKNVIRADYNCLESYLGETDVTSPIIEKPNVWSPIIANFSLDLRGKALNARFNHLRSAQPFWLACILIWSKYGAHAIRNCANAPASEMILGCMFNSPRLL
jgi:hypothetical protein